MASYGEDEDRRELDQAMELNFTSSQSQGTPPLIRVRQMEDLLTPSNSPPVTATSRVHPSTSTTPKSQGNGNGGNRSLPSIFPNSQKRKAPVTTKASPIKKATPNAPGKQRTPKPKTPSITATATPQPGTSSSNKKKSYRYRKPTAENTGMKKEALLRYFIKPEKEPKSTIAQLPQVGPTPKDASAQNDRVTPPLPVRDQQDNINHPELIELVEQSDGDEENEVDGPVPPAEMVQNIFRTPPKSRPPEMANGVTSITIIPRPHAPPKMKSSQPPADKTPPHEEPPQSPADEPVRRQLFPGTRRVPPQQKNPEETRLRVEAYRRWQNADSSEEEDSAKENEALSSTPASPAGDSDCTRDNDNEEGQGGNKRRRYRSVPVSKNKPTLQRRTSNNSSSDGGGGGKKKFLDSGTGTGIPSHLAKALKKQCGVDVTSGREPEDEKAGLILDLIRPVHLAYLLGRCSWFMDTTTMTLATPKQEQLETLEFLAKGIQSVLEYAIDDEEKGPARRAETVPHLLETFDILYTNSRGANANPVNSYWEIFMDLFKRPVEQSRRRLKEEEPLKVCEWIVKLMEVTYKEYLATRVKVNFPFVARLFQGPPTTNLNHKRNVIRNFQELVSLIFSAEEKSKEFMILMTIFNLAVDFYDCIRVQYYCTEEEMLDALWDAIKSRPDTGMGKDWGLPLIKRIQRKSFGRNICRRILVENLEEVGYGSELTQDQIDLLLKDIAQSPLVLQRVIVEYDHGRREDRQVDNLKGETPFHRACALRPTDKMSTKVKWERSLENLNRLLEELLDPATEVPAGDINAVDNNGNTPLADACQNGRLDAIKLIFDKCWNPREAASRRNLDILAVDAHGNTLLHIALSSLKARILGGAEKEVLDEKVEVVEFLVRMAGQCRKKFQILFGSNNKMEESIFSYEILGNPVSAKCQGLLDEHRKATMEHLNSSIAPLGINSVAKIQGSAGLQSILAYWEYFTEENL